MQELSATARAHFEHPRNAGCLPTNRREVATVRVEVPTSGEILQLQLGFNEDNVIIETRFKAYGCGWMIACGSLLTEHRLQEGGCAASFMLGDLFGRSC